MSEQFRMCWCCLQIFGENLLAQKIDWWTGGKSRHGYSSHLFDRSASDSKRKEKNKVLLFDRIDYGQIYNDLDAPDNDLQTLTQIKTRARCVEECRNNPKCVGVSYKSSDDRCYLKSSISGLVSTVGVDTVALTSISKFIMYKQIL